ncbi:hypothetical protein EYF80_032020 [Liparis tanakae]|uniref:Uncharacterized protein n=1 Tax=Liparis tanakae TaxID=230148 RepID=A0A4Z2GYK9_9TELE|nr:hypothetical protein EYF80_032020 [Liparis tanakae]
MALSLCSLSRCPAKWVASAELQGESSGGSHPKPVSLSKWPAGPSRQRPITTPAEPLRRGVQSGGRRGASDAGEPTDRYEVAGAALDISRTSFN